MQREPEISNELSLHLDTMRSMAMETTTRMARPIRELGIPVVCRVILHQAGIHTVGDLVRCTPADLLDLTLMTFDWLWSIETALTDVGLRLRSTPTV